MAAIDETTQRGLGDLTVKLEIPRAELADRLGGDRDAGLAHLARAFEGAA
jgi:hypothetical protein